MASELKRSSSPSWWGMHISVSKSGCSHYLHPQWRTERGEWWYSAELLLLPHFSKEKKFGYRMPVHKMTIFFYLNPIPCPYSGTFPEVQMIANLGRLTKINHHNTKIKYNTSSSKDLHNYFIKTLLMIT